MALGMLAVYGLLALVWRSALHRRRTGDSGSRLAATTTMGKVAAAMMTSAHVLAFVGVVLQGAVASAAVVVVSVLVFAAGLALVVTAQATMGASWRVGVDPNEHTELVIDGVFGRVRNPIFTGMTLCLGAVAACSMSLIAGLGVALFVAGIEIQVRAVEEPYLQRVHGASFRSYLEHTGRFLP